jgi:hypothetical protein
MVWTGTLYLFTKVIQLWKEIQMKKGEGNKKKVPLNASV